MASKKPKMPAAPVIIYQTPEPAAPAVTQNTSASDPPAGSGGGEAFTAPEATPDEQRLQNILIRRRGRLGTIATSFGGVLNNAVTPARKTLLGE